MSKSINRSVLLGHLGADPEIRAFPDGRQIATFRLATSQSWKDQTTGEPREHTEWHSIAVSGGLVKVVERFLRKGSRVYLEGQLFTRKWQDRDGHDRWTTEVRVGPRGQLLLLGVPVGPPDSPAGAGEAATPPADDDVPF